MTNDGEEGTTAVKSSGPFRIVFFWEEIITEVCDPHLSLDERKKIL